MAKFPIYQSDMQPPGVSGSVRHGYSTATGGEEVGRALQQFGATAFDVSMDLYRQQGESELAEAMAGANDSIQQMHLRFAQNPDENTYQEDFDETWSSEVATREIKNGWAKREYNLRLPALRTRQQEIVQETVRKKVEEKHKWTVANAEAKAIQGRGSIAALDALLAGDVARGLMTAEEKEFRLAKVTHDAQRTAADRLAMSPNPDAILQFKTYDEMAQDPRFSALTSGDYQDLHASALGQKRELQRRQEALSVRQLEGIYGSVRTQPLEAVKQKISQSDGLTETQKIEAMQIVVKASNLWGKEKVNPWEVTRDHKSLVAALVKIRTEKITTDGQLMAEWLKGAEPHWALRDYQMLKNVLVRKNGGYEPDESADPVATQYVDALLKYWLDADGQTDDPAGLTAELNKTLTAIEKHRNDPNALEKAVAPVIEKAKEQKARRFLTGWAGVKKAWGYWWRPESLWQDLFTGRYMTGTEETATQPKDQAEYDALPKGAEYQRKDGSIWVKK